MKALRSFFGHKRSKSSDDLAAALQQRESSMDLDDGARRSESSPRGILKNQKSSASISIFTLSSSSSVSKGRIKRGVSFASVSDDSVVSPSASASSSSSSSSTQQQHWTLELSNEDDANANNKNKREDSAAVSTPPRRPLSLTKPSFAPSSTSPRTASPRAAAGAAPSPHTPRPGGNDEEVLASVLRSNPPNSPAKTSSPLSEEAEATSASSSSPPSQNKRATRRRSNSKGKSVADYPADEEEENRQQTCELIPGLGLACVVS